MKPLPQPNSRQTLGTGDLSGPHQQDRASTRRRGRGRGKPGGTGTKAGPLALRPHRSGSGQTGGPPETGAGKSFLSPGHIAAVPPRPPLAGGALLRACTLRGELVQAEPARPSQNVPKELTSEHQTSWRERGGHKSFSNTERHPERTEGEQRQEGEERALSAPSGARPPPQHPGGSAVSPAPGRAPHTRHCDTSSNRQLLPIRQGRKVFSIKEYN